MSEENPTQPTPTTRPRRRHRVAPADQALTPRERQFVDEYLLDLNGTQAAIRAGYSSRTAAVTASQLLIKPKIQTALQEAFKRVLLRYAAPAIDASTASICWANSFNCFTTVGFDQNRSGSGTSPVGAPPAPDVRRRPTCGGDRAFAHARHHHEVTKNRKGGPSPLQRHRRLVDGAINEDRSFY